MQHRIYLVPPRPGIDRTAAQAHWHTNHMDIMCRLPGLLGYVQNRPVQEAARAAPRYLACAETWFADRAAEARAYAEPWYLEQIAVDEERIFARDEAWQSVVVSAEVLRPGPTERFRVLAFGADGDPPRAGGRVERMRLRRAPPGRAARTADSVWTGDIATAGRLAGSLGGLAFVTEPAVGIAPDASPWRKR